VSFQVRIKPGVPQGTVISNQATIGGPEVPQPVPSDTVTTTVGPSQPVLLSLTKVVDKQSAAAGEILTYTLGYSNNGSQALSGLQIVDPLPANVSFVDADNGGQVDAGSVRWNLPTVGPNSQGSVQFRVQVNQGVPAGTTITNQGRIGGPQVAEPITSQTVNTTVGGGQPGSSFAGSWFAVPPTGHAVSLTVDSRNKFTVWAVSADRSTVQRSAQGTLNQDGSFDVFSADQSVRFTGQVAADGQSARVEATRQGFVTFGVTAPRAPDVNPLPDNLVGTWNGFGVAANGDRLQVRLSIDPTGNSTFHGDVVRTGATTRNQFAHFYITPQGQVINPDGNQQVGTLQQQGGQLVFTYTFQHSAPPPYTQTFQVPLQPLP
jgi:uncharacterized repeat protein (TIGR01451 family)